MVSLVKAFATAVLMLSAIFIVSAGAKAAEDVESFLYFDRVMMPQGQGDTSPCIGSVETPECAVETYLACVERHHAPYCDLAYPGSGHDISYTVDGVVHYPLEGPPDLALYTRYDFTRVEPAEKYAEAFIRYPVQPGDMVVGTASMTCYRDYRELCEMSYSYADVPYFEWLYLLRRHEKGWRIEGISDGYRPKFSVVDLYKSRLGAF